MYEDAAGNLRGELPAAEPEAPRLVIGSHLDTVANAGAFDGILGVVLGVAMVEEMVKEARASVPAAKALPFAIEVIGFSEEEGVRFAKPFLGSLAVIGELDATILARTDANGVSVARRDSSVRPGACRAARRGCAGRVRLWLSRVPHRTGARARRAKMTGARHRRRPRRPDPHGVHLHRAG